MELRPVVKDYAPLEDGGTRLGARGEPLAMDQFPFAAALEAFHGGIIVAVAPACVRRCR